MDSAMTYRRRRRADLSQEQDRASYRNQYYGSSERISISTEHYSDAVDYCGRGAVGVLGLNVSASGLRQPIRRGVMKEAPLVSAKGVKLWLAYLTVIMLFLTMVGVTGYSFSRMKAAESRVANIERDIENQRITNADLQEQLNLKRNNINIAYEAARIGMISAGSAETILIRLDQTTLIQTGSLSTTYLAGAGD